LPFWQAYPAKVQVDKDMKAESAQRPEAMMLPRNMLPSLWKLIVAKTNLVRRIAVLRSFEAIRLHAAQNRGELLAKWGDLHGVPVPLDPATGQPFDYRREGDRAILNVPVLPGSRLSAIRYEISLAK
jgi:hypothetical protein